MLFAQSGSPAALRNSDDARALLGVTIVVTSDNRFENLGTKRSEVLIVGDRTMIESSRQTFPLGSALMMAALCCRRPSGSRSNLSHGGRPLWSRMT